jgi:hypothetical protein
VASQRPATAGRSLAAGAPSLEIGPKLVKLDGALTSWRRFLALPDLSGNGAVGHHRQRLLETFQVVWAN